MKSYSHTWEQAVQSLRDDPHQSILVQQCYFDDPLPEAAERFRQSEEWQETRNLFRRIDKGDVLDLGAGRGIASYAFAREGYNVTALEPDPSPLVGAKAIGDMAGSTNLPINIVIEWGEKLPFPDNNFDIVYARQALHHAHDLGLLCQEAARVLKPGGQFLAVREHVIARKADLPLFLDSHPLHHLYGGENAFLLDEYRNAIKSAGLTLQKTIAPLDSVINYAPRTVAERRTLATPLLMRILGKTTGECLGQIQWIQDVYAGLKARIGTPGEMYSFLATKPTPQ